MSFDPDNNLSAKAWQELPELEQVEQDCLLSVNIAIGWQGQDCQFTDWLYIPSINICRDCIPAEIEMQLPGKRAKDYIEHHYAPGELVESWQSSHHLTLSREQFQPPHTLFKSTKPAVGRYYPAEFFIDVPVSKGNEYPCRIIAMDDDSITVDFNHPLSKKALDLILQIDHIQQAGTEKITPGKDIAAMVCDLGPGMQDKLPEQDTDFWSDNPFSRIDPGDDSVFFQEPSFTPYWDNLALQQVSKMYQQLIPQRAQALDLMAGVHSPLQQTMISMAGLSCAGLNQQELDHNPICSERIVLDVNTLSRLPFSNKQFDVVLIHAAIEYVIHPELLFREITRVLKPSGRLIISFSNRSEPDKAIKLWTTAHEFERPAIVLSYLRSTRSFSNFRSFSQRGLLCPEQDELADRVMLSDPVFMVWADKQS